MWVDLDKNLFIGQSILDAMTEEKAPEMRYQCLNCYKTHKTEQSALDCCNSMIQAWCINYNKWGKQHWYGR